MQNRTKGCLWLALGVVSFVVIVGVAVIGGLGYIVYQQFSVKSASVEPADASHQLDDLRGRFAGQAPRLRITHRPDGRPDVQIDGARPSSSTRLTELHVAAFDPSEKKLVRVTVPFWILRFAPEGKMKVIGADVLNDVQTPSGTLTAKDIEAFGPGLLVDDSRPDGTRLIIWTE
jgi:hypothetical protein